MKLEINNISKRFGNVQALRDVSLKFSENKIYGLLGRNGAGKTTLLKIMAARSFADEGTVTIDGKDISQADNLLSKIFSVGDCQTFPEEMKFSKAVKTCSAFFGVNFCAEAANNYAKKFGLDVNKKISKLSTGYCSIYKDCLALAMDTPFVFFDEPVLGLDANHRDLFYKLLIESWTRCPKTIIVSTHLIEEVAPVIEEVIIIHNGTLLLQRDAQELSNCGFVASGSIEDVNAFTANQNVIGENIIGSNLKNSWFIVSGSGNEVPKTTEKVSVGKMDLQQLFIHLTNDEDAEEMK